MMTGLSAWQRNYTINHLIEVKGISPDDSYELQSDINQINIIMIDSDEVEAKINLSLCALVFTGKNKMR